MTGCITTIVIVFAVLIADDEWDADPWVKWPVLLAFAFVAGYVAPVVVDRIVTGRWRWRPGERLARPVAPGDVHAVDQRRDGIDRGDHVVPIQDQPDGEGDRRQHYCH